MLLIWTIDGSDRNRPYALDPVDFVRSASAVQVGIARIDVAARTLVESRYGGDDDTVEVVAEPTPGVRCTITSGYGRPLDDRTLPVAEKLGDGQGTRTEWRRDRAGTKWQAGVDATDTVTISCDDADVARELATSARFP